MPVQTIKCPLCGKEMLKKNVPPGLELDYCNEHGVWLDGGELERIAAEAASTAPTSSGGAPAKGADGSLLKGVASHLGRSAVFGAGASVGHRVVGGIIDSLFKH